MHAEVNALDSGAAGATVVDVHEFDAGADFARFESGAIRPLNPAYAFCKVPASGIGAIQQLEDLGFRFAELQIAMTCRVDRRLDTSRFHCHFERVTTEEQLAPAMEMAGTIFAHDRFSTDPLLGPEVSSRRYRALLRRSFESPDDRVYVMKDDATGAPASFASIRVSGTEARLLIGGVANQYKGTGMGVAHDYVGWNAYYDEGIRRMRTAVSAINIPIMNLEIGHLNFRVTGSSVVVRKSYTA